jgi:hypothetical protein
MARRIEVELTSSREDGTWTWRAAGARKPKGDLASSLLYTDAAVGDVVKVEAEFLLDGIEILEVFPPKKRRDRSLDLLELKSRPLRDDELVTEVRAPKGRGGGRSDDRGGRDGRGKGRNERSGEGHRGGSRPSDAEARPKPKRLRPRRDHRNAVLAEVPEEHRPIAEQVQQGGMPAVRAAIEKQNEEAKAAGSPVINADPIIAIAEPLVPKMQTAEWRDRADAALADMAELDLRDLRSVVVASDSAARDEEGRALAEQLKAGLSERIEQDHTQWLTDLQEAVDGGRTVRALRLSSRPVKAGAPLPTELANRLSAAAAAALAADVMPDRWATVLDALAFTPIRSAVTPAGYPAEPTPELLEAVRRVADRVPVIAAHFGIDPAEATKARKRRPNRRKPASGKGSTPAAAKAVAPTDAEKPTEASAPVESETPAEAVEVTALAPTEAVVDATVSTEAPVEAATAEAATAKPAEAKAPVEMDVPTQAPVEAATAEPAGVEAPVEAIAAEPTETA